MNICGLLNIAFLVRLTHYTEKRKVALDKYIGKMFKYLLLFLVAYYVLISVVIIFSDVLEIQAAIFSIFAIAVSVVIAFYGVRANRHVLQLRHKEISLVRKITFICIGFGILYFVISGISIAVVVQRKINSELMIYINDCMKYIVIFMTIYEYWQDPTVTKLLFCSCCYKDDKFLKNDEYETIENDEQEYEA